MAEYIEREAVVRYLLKCADGYSYIETPTEQTIQAVNAIPAADVVPVRHGHWVWNPNGMDWGLGAWVCSECHAKPGTWWDADKKNNPYRCSGGHFCGNCGALMDKDGDGKLGQRIEFVTDKYVGRKCKPCKPTQPECGDCEYIKDGDGE